MSDTDQRPPSTPDRPAAVEELMALLEECHAELARDGTISPTLIDAPGEIERLVDEALDSQLGEREREQLRKHIEEQGQSTDTALRAVLRDEEGRKRADGDTLIGDGGLPDHIGRINGFGDGPDWYRCQECGATGATLDTIDHREQCPSERRAVADGGEERVWVRSATDGKSRTHYHTDQDCHALDLANDVVRKPLAVLADDIQECRLCAGSVTRHSGGPSTTVADRLEAMDPGDLGSPAGEDNGDTLIGDGGRMRPPREVREDPTPAPEDQCIECGKRGDLRCGCCGFPLCGKHVELGGGFCSEHFSVGGVSVCTYDFEVYVGVRAREETVLVVEDNGVYHLPDDVVEETTAPACRPAEDGKERVPLASAREEDRELCTHCAAEARSRHEEFREEMADRWEAGDGGES